MSINPSNRRTTYFPDPVAFDAWDPFSHLGEPFSPPLPLRPHFAAGMAASAVTTTGVECTQTPTAHIFKLNLPGFKREEVTIDLNDGGVLKIAGEKRVEKEDRSDRWHHMERSSGRFMTSFVLPENCNPYEMEAAMENGVLTIKVPKLEARHRRGEWANIAVR